MKIIIITVIIIAVVILGGRWYLHWLKKCYDRKQKQCREQESFIFDKLNQGENLSKTYDRLRNSAKKTIIVLSACILVLGGGAYFVDASYEQWSTDFKQWSTDFKQWKVERAERKALAEFQKQKEKRLEAERKAEEARKLKEAEKLRAEQLKKQQEAEQLKAEKSQRPTDKFFSFTKNYFAYSWEQGIIATFVGGVFYLFIVVIIASIVLGTLGLILACILLPFEKYL